MFIVIYFLTILVDTGGNAGNQASVRVILGLALGALNEKNTNSIFNTFIDRRIKSQSLWFVLPIS